MYVDLYEMFEQPWLCFRIFASQDSNIMPKILSIEELFRQFTHLPIVDVRSPSEYETGHIPGSTNIPLFSNNERAKVGTRYKQSGRENAVELGLEIVGPKLSDFVKQAKKVAQNKTLVLHCWRGGMRSASMAWLFETAGLDVYIIQSGYKAYRQFIRQCFARATKIFILGGYTGSGKTDILKELCDLGEQVIDLEGLANHKGSAFGGIGHKKQPTNEQFENNLAVVWQTLDLNRTIWIEDESISIGKVGVPDTLYRLMRKAPVLRVIVPKTERAKRLVDEYAGLEKAQLELAILHIKDRLGGLNTKLALDALEADNYKEVANITLTYYDKAYLKGLSKRNPELITELTVEKDDPDFTAKKIIEITSK